MQSQMVPSPHLKLLIYKDDMPASLLVIQVAALFHSNSSLLALCIYLLFSTIVFHLLLKWATLFVLSAQISKMTAVGFEPTPFRNGALSHRLRPLGQTVGDGARASFSTVALLNVFALRQRTANACELFIKAKRCYVIRKSTESYIRLFSLVGRAPAQ